ncbi:hypothetical protein [Ulvibacterium sp.]|uniref:hypothetical protein n=1 Tax=Ulvibacterium sp. TaxID=2665914 RepID=UPI003BAD35F2
MKEETVKELVQGSLIGTSEGFLDGLMDKVRTTKKTEKSRKRPFRTSLFCTIALAIALSFVLYGLFDGPKGIPGFGADAPVTPIFILATLLLLFGIGHILKLRDMEKKYLDT